jgi:aerobic carbon-monoxide dehydrogenase medium subunit
VDAFPWFAKETERGDSGQSQEIIARSNASQTVGPAEPTRRTDPEIVCEHRGGQIAWTDIVKPSAFDYHLPDSPTEVVEILARHGEVAKVLAGGQSLIPMLALRIVAFEHLVDIGRIIDLQGIDRHGSELSIGACTTSAAVERSPEIAEMVPLLNRASPLIGHFPIRNRGTLGGSIAHADPAAEYPGVAVALDATMHVLSTRGLRSIAARDFFTGVWSTAMGSDELLLSVSFPVWGERSGFAVEELSRRHGDFAVAGALVGIEVGPDKSVTRCAIGLIGLGSTPLRASVAEAAVTGQHITEIRPRDVGELAMGSLGAVPDDLHGSSNYRKKVGALVIARAWEAASEDVRDG